MSLDLSHNTVRAQHCSVPAARHVDVTVQSLRFPRDWARPETGTVKSAEGTLKVAVSSELNSTESGTEGCSSQSQFRAVLKRLPDMPEALHTQHQKGKKKKKTEIRALPSTTSHRSGVLGGLLNIFVPQFPQVSDENEESIP